MIGNKVPIWGRLPCKYLIVGEGPGLQESISGIPFSGASGAELDWVFLKRAARMRREDFAVTNIVKWRTDEDDSDPTAADIERDREELQAEIAVCDPEIIVAVGKVAARWFLTDPDDFTNWVKGVQAGVRPDIDLEKIHGVPLRCPMYSNKLLICTFHPAAGLHAPERYYHLIYWDFKRLGELARGEIGISVDKGPVPKYTLLENEATVGQGEIL